MGLVNSKINETDDLKFENLPKTNNLKNQEIQKNHEIRKNHEIFLKPVGPLGILLNSTKMK